jgi:hypothetical protein
MQTNSKGIGHGSPGYCPDSRRLVGSLLLLFLLLCGGVSYARAAAGAGDPPVYNPVSKSYFQMLGTTGRHGNWPESLEQARAQTFKGVRGRLAVIDSLETHEFVMRNFDVSHPVWIGLRYWCEFRMLEWVGLRPYSPGDPGRYQAWHPQWSRGDQFCPPNASGPGAFLGVYYQPISDSSALWQAVRTGKGFGRLLVEFPTGGE